MLRIRIKIFVFCVLIAFVIICAGCAHRYERYIKSVRDSKYERFLMDQVKSIDYSDGIDRPEADILISNFIYENGNPWEDDGSHSLPQDRGETWISEFVDLYGRIQANSNGIEVDKATGEVKREKSTQ